MPERVLLGDLLDVVIDHRGKTPKKLGGDWSQCGVPVVSAIHVKDGRIKWDERTRFVSPEMYEKWMPIPLKKGDVLLTSEAPLGQVALVPTDAPLVLSQRLFALRGRSGILDNGYLRYFLSSAEGQAQLVGRSTGTTVIGIRQSQLVQIRVPLLPFEEQRRIAEVLEALDDLIDTNHRLMDAIEGAAFAACQHAAAKVELQPFGAFARRLRTVAQPGELDPSTRYVGLEHLGLDGRGLIDVGSTSDVNSSAQFFSAGDVLYGKLRPYFRKVCRPGFGGVCSSEIWVLRPIADIGAAYLHWLSASRSFTDRASASSGGTRMPRADWAHVAGTEVPIPTAAALHRLEDELQPCWELHWELFEEVRDLARTRDELLPLLMSGRVRPGEVAV